MPAQDTAEPATGSAAAIVDEMPQARGDGGPSVDGRVVAADVSGQAADCGARESAGSPLGGSKRPGVRREMGIVGMEEFVERKTFALPVTGRSA